MATGANGLSAFHFQLLEDLMRTKKLSATAANLDISVSRASRMLMQLRQVFNEPLFTTSTAGLQPTKGMLRMAERLDVYLRAFEDLMAPRVFNPEHIQGNFQIASCGLVMPNILFRIFEQIRVRAPKLRITLEHRTPHIWTDLKEGRIDLGLTTDYEVPPSCRKTLLFRSPAVVLMRENHPLLEEVAAKNGVLSAEMLERYPRAAVSINTSGGLLTLERAVTSGSSFTPAAVVSESGYDLMPLIEKTDVIMLTPLAGAEVVREHYAVSWLPAASAGVADFEVYQVWTENKHLDPAHCWVRGLVEGAVREQVSGETSSSSLI